MEGTYRWASLVTKVLLPQEAKAKTPAKYPLRNELENYGKDLNGTHSRKLTRAKS